MFGLPTWAIKAIGIGILVLVLLGTGARIAAIWYAPQVAGLKAQAHEQVIAAKAITVVQKALTKTDAAAETTAQAKIVYQIRTIIKKVPTYVSRSPAPPVGCVTNGMLRLHDAFVLGIDPADIHPPAGLADSTCSTVAPSDFMAAVGNNYGLARQNAQQLGDLEADLKQRIAALDLNAK